MAGAAAALPSRRSSDPVHRRERTPAVRRGAGGAARLRLRRHRIHGGRQRRVAARHRVPVLDRGSAALHRPVRRRAGRLRAPRGRAGRRLRSAVHPTCLAADLSRPARGRLSTPEGEPMRVDDNIGGGIDGTGGGDLACIAEQVAAAERAGHDGVWTTEVSRDPFLPLLLAAGQSRTLTLGTAVAVAFARNPMTLAMVANDLQSFSSGRFVLGLGSQIKAHIRRRFSMPWSEPAARMREFVLALRAIWASWQDGGQLDFRGEFYRHTLMTPMFTPDPNPWGAPPVLLAAVGPRMTQVAAEVADGLILHGFTTERYLREVTWPIIEAGLTN